MFYHAPILVEEICEKLAWSKIDRLCDLTVGGGGHLEALLSRFPRPKEIFAFDQDPEALAAAKERLKKFEPIVWVHSNYRKFPQFISGPLDRVVVDLGVSSFQLDSKDRGFSFQKDGPLDMRMNPTEGEPAWEYLAHCGEADLAKVLWEFGEERQSRQLARRWIERRNPDIKTTGKFVEALGFSLDSKDKRGRHPLTRVFQAIRMKVNEEIESLDDLLRELPKYLAPQGRLAILTFHSLEDREVKWQLRGRLKPLNKKVITASDDEVRQNLRARSAKLRAFEADEIK